MWLTCMRGDELIVYNWDQVENIELSPDTYLNDVKTLDQNFKSATDGGSSEQSSEHFVAHMMELSRSLH